MEALRPSGAHLSTAARRRTTGLSVQEPRSARSSRQSVSPFRPIGVCLPPLPVQATAGATSTAGAAPSSEDLKRTIIETFDCDLYDAFGQTEMSPVTTMLLPDDALEKPDSIGKPVINVQLKVVGDDGERVERGEIGRAAYKGPTAFKGYHGLPERTAEVFTDGWFVSGDLVRRDDDGFVYFVGRADDMIVSGGENIYPAEIEDVLFEHPAIDEVAVIGVPDETWGERVKAAVVFEAGESLTDDEIAAYVSERLAGYKKPREIEVYESLPRNPSGKVLRAELANDE